MNELKDLQSLPLERKIGLAQAKKASDEMRKYYDELKRREAARAADYALAGRY